MEPEKNYKIGSWLVIGACVTAYIFFMYNVFASAYLSWLSNHAGSVFT